jgi:hypothetical protein
LAAQVRKSFTLWQCWLQILAFFIEFQGSVCLQVWVDAAIAGRGGKTEEMEQ